MEVVMRSEDPNQHTLKIVFILNRYLKNQTVIIVLLVFLETPIKLQKKKNSRYQLSFYKERNSKVICWVLLDIHNFDFFLNPNFIMYLPSPTEAANANVRCFEISVMIT
jgi:hypothetical protein